MKHLRHPFFIRRHNDNRIQIPFAQIFRHACKVFRRPLLCIKRCGRMDQRDWLSSIKTIEAGRAKFF